jgi:hypothetical protein
MPAKSKAQQKLMGMVHATQTGQIKAPSEKVAQLSKSMTKKSAGDYASTKHKGLPKKVKKKSIKENMDYENKVGSMHMVQKPYDGCSMETLVYEIDPITGIQQHGVDAQTVHGIYPTPEEAQKVAEKLYNEHMGSMKKLEEKKGKVATKLTSAITMLEKKHKDLMEMAKANPKEAASHKSAISEIQAKIQELMDKLEMVEKSKKPIETEEEKETLKESQGQTWNIGDKLEVPATDIVYTINPNPKNPNKVILSWTDRKGKKQTSDTWISHMEYYMNKGAWKIIGKEDMQENTEESFEEKLKKSLEDLKINAVIEQPGKNKAVIVYDGGEQMYDEDVEMLKTKYNVFPHPPEDGQQKWYYTVQSKNVKEAFEADYGKWEYLADMVEDAMFAWLEAHDYELGDDAQIETDAEELTSKIVSKYINSAYTNH